MGSRRTATGRLFTQSMGSSCLDFGRAQSSRYLHLVPPGKTDFAFFLGRILLQVNCRDVVLARNPTSLLVINNGQQM
jgi:hypothetical protein